MKDELIKFLDYIKELEITMEDPDDYDDQYRVCDECQSSTNFVETYLKENPRIGNTETKLNLILQRIEQLIYFGVLKPESRKRIKDNADMMSIIIEQTHDGADFQSFSKDLIEFLKEKG